MSDQFHEDRRVRRTKKLITDAFLDLLKENDFKHISVTDIVTRADYNRTTFYRHFKDKHDLVDQIILHYSRQLINSFKKPYTEENYVRLEQLTESDITVFNHVIDHITFYQLWSKFEDIPGFEEQFLRSIATFYKNEIVLINIPVKGLDKSLYTTFYAYGILGLILDWIKGNLQESPDYMATQLCKILKYHPSESFLKNVY